MEPAGLTELSRLLEARNRIDTGIAVLIGRPAERGHIGEFIASRVFDIESNPNATHEVHDGRFRSGPFSGQSVNIKWYGKEEGFLDVSTGAAPDRYLVLTGPRGAAASSVGTTRALVISSVFLFLHQELLAAGVRPGTASSVRGALWEGARIHPSSEGKGPMVLSPDQVRLLSLFAPEEVRP